MYVVFVDNACFRSLTLSLFNVNAKPYNVKSDKRERNREFRTPFIGLLTPGIAHSFDPFVVVQHLIRRSAEPNLLYFITACTFIAAFMRKTAISYLHQYY